MISIENFKKLSFLVYGLGSTGQSVIKFFNKLGIKKFQVWDDFNLNLYKSKRPLNLYKVLSEVDYIVLSPGVSIHNPQNKKKLKKYKNKIITDLDIIFLLKKFFKSIVVTGTNGKSTTCKILAHVLKKNNFNVMLGGNIGTPVLNLKFKNNCYAIIEASSFQLAYSKYIQPDYALLLNVSNDHLDWHGSMQNYINSKFKIFNNQKKNQYSLINDNLKTIFKKKNFKGKLIIPNLKNYQKKKNKIKNFYLKLKINDENVSSVFAITKLLKIKEKSLIQSLNTFQGLPHRYEIFYRKKNCTFINDSKATSFQASKLALQNSKNIFWIVGGLPKKNDKFILNDLKKNIVKSYIIGKNTNFFKKQIQNKINYSTTRNLKSAILKIFEDIKLFLV